MREHELQQAEGGWSLREAGVRLTTGMRFAAGLDRVTTTLVYGLDGTKSVREALPEADETHSVESLAEIGLSVARQMFELGFLTRA